MPRGAKIAAQQTVIVSDRHSRESNDLNQAKPYRPWLTLAESRLLMAVC
jgi:hypothetical protein